MAVLKAYGLEQDLKDKLKLKLWFEDLQHLPMSQYEKAIVQLRKAHTSWYPSDNVPALILDQVAAIPKVMAYHITSERWLEMREENNIRLLNQGGDDVTQKTRNDYEHMLSFIEAYPFPEYPKKSTSQKQDEIDRNYCDLMHKNGMRPHDVTSMEFNKLMVKRLMEIAFPG